MANSEFITKLKNQVVKSILNDEEIITAIDSPDMLKDNWEPIYLLNNRDTINAGFTPSIYRELQVPRVLDDAGTAILIEVQFPRPSGVNNLYLTVQLQIMIISHQEHMRIDNVIGVTDNRNDYLSILLDRKFNDDMGFERINLISSVANSYNEKYVYRTMTFECLTINNLRCDR